MMKLRNLLNESKIYKDVTHGTTKQSAESIMKSGFKLPKRGALFFDANGQKGSLHQVYGSDATITVDLMPKKIIKMSDVRSKIFPEMKAKGIIHNEINTHKYLSGQGYDLIDNTNELIVLDPKIIKIKRN